MIYSSRFLLIILFLIPFKFTVWTQSSNNADTLVEEAIFLKEKGNLDTANEKLKLASDIYKKEGNIGLYLKYSAELGKNLLDNGEAAAALKLLENLVKEAESLSLNNEENLALPYKYLGTLHYEKDDLLKATPLFKKALEIREKANPKSPELFRDFYNLGVMYRNSTNYAASIKHLLKAVEIYQAKEAGPLSLIYKNIAITYRLMGSFSEAEDYIDLALKYADEKYGSSSINYAETLIERGAIVRESALNFETMSKSVTIFSRALNIYEKQNQKNTDNYALCLMNIGISHLYGIEPQYNEADEIKAAQKAIPFLEDAVTILNKNNPKGTTAFIAKNNLASAYAKARKAEKSEKLAKDASDMAKELYEENNPIFSNISLVYAENYEYQKKYEDALIMIHEAIVNLSAPGDLNSTPDWKLIEENKIEHLNLLKDLIAKKARIYIKKYKTDKSTTNLELALKHIEFTDKIADKIRADYTAEGGKMIVSDMIIDAYEMAISTCLELSKIKKDPSYKEKAYFYSEKSKSLMLLEAFQNSKAAKLAGLSDKILREEEALRLSISDLKQQLYQYKSRGEINLADAKKVEKALFNKKQEYSRFTKKVEKENPDYFKMKFDLKISNLTETRKLLKKDQALVEYFTGNTKLFIFKITADEFEVFESDNNQDLSELSKKFRESIYGFYLSSDANTDDSYDKFARDYSNYGSILFDRLIKPLGKLPKKLVIVPAGPLANIPFEPLLSTKPTNHLQFKTHKYFGLEYILSYSYSGTLLAEMSSKTNSAYLNNFIGFAPSFGADNKDGVTMRNRRFALAPLNFNNKEINDVKKILGTGAVYIGKDATEERFKKDGSKYRIIHFATHGMANDRDPDFSLLAFTEIRDSVENEFLYVSDLYNLKLNADLVVLSACETGLGEIRRGEGVISLARGFSYAGAKSIFTTLWSVNDQSTAMIIESFYKYLKEGKEKDEALHLAKSDFIKSADSNRAHPFLWAPYILIGDSSVINLSNSKLWIYITVGGAIIILTIASILIYRKSNKQST
jgi:CHAT domain-containing protein